jgi:taurine dioxygenase
MVCASREEMMADFKCGRMSWKPLKVFGAQVDFDLSENMADEETKCFVHLFNHYDLLVFHGQKVNLERQGDIVSNFGPIRRTSENMGYLTNEANGNIGNVAGLAFHSDYAWAPSPIMALSLHAVDLVDGASSTKFASAVRAYETLPEKTKVRLKGVDVDIVPPLYDKTEKAGRELDPGAFVLHERRPAVQTCDRTGRPYLMVNWMQALYLYDMPAAESDALLKEIFEHLYRADNLHEHVWRNGDFVLWNNRTLHHARGNMSQVGKRLLQRVAAGLSLHEQYPDLAKSYNEGVAVEKHAGAIG